MLLQNFIRETISQIKEGSKGRDIKEIEFDLSVGPRQTIEGIEVNVGNECSRIKFKIVNHS